MPLADDDVNVMASAANSLKSAFFRASGSVLWAENSYQSKIGDAPADGSQEHSVPHEFP
jgi:hypothetical protein